MIEFLTGKVLKKEPTHIVLDVNGVGYGIHVSLRTSERIPDPGKQISLRTYLNVKEDILELYGFEDGSERTLFLKLISVSGIGPKVALRMLSVVGPGDLIKIISEGDVNGLTSLKGIGKKTAEVMIATLRTPLSKLILSGDSPGLSSTLQNEQQSDAVLALIALGVKEKQAITAVEKALKQLGTNPESQELVSIALKLV